MTDATLSGLIDRVEGATGPDREIDRALASLAGPRHFSVGLELEELAEGRERELSETTDFWCVTVLHASGGSANGGYRKITDSIEAGFNLIEDLLPNTLRCVGTMEDGPFCRLVVPDGNGGYINGAISANANTEPLAIILALLRALQSKPSP